MTDDRLTIRIRAFRNRSCAQVAETLSDIASKSSHLVTTCDMHESIATDERPDLVVYIFPVLSDERIPDPVEAILADAPLEAGAHAVCVTGDFTTGEIPTSRVSTEADRILRARGSTRRGDSILIDTPLAPGWIPRLVTAFQTVLDNTGADDDDAPPVIETANRARIDDPEARALADRLPMTPRFEFDDDGRCIGLDLTDGAPYPRGILASLEEHGRHEIFDIISAMPALERLDLSFSRLTAIPVALPASLRELNLTGNELESFDLLEQLPDLLWLNLAACNLRAVPRPIESLRRLHTLIIAKNRIPELPAWMGSLTSLHRMTCYRNLLRSFPESLGSLERIRILNIGASPVEHVDPAIGQLHELRALGVCMTSITALPDELFRLPNLQAVDISKNPQLDPNVLSDQALSKCVVAMPSWNSYGTHRDIQARSAASIHQ